jgi:5,10-methenyltetrahydrofolate synthetase
VVVEANAALFFREWTPQTTLIADRYGIPTPVDGDFVQPEALLLPLNAFDAAGYRIGYGGGYFDRTLAALRQQAKAPLAIGVGFELARVDSIHPEAHDQALDAVVTEAGVFRTLSKR